MSLHNQSGDVRAVSGDSSSYPLGQSLFETEVTHHGLITSIPSPSSTVSYLILKRIFDIFVVVLMLPVILVVGGTTALLVMLSSPGPIFFSHRRIRQGGAFFSMWKFRTMCVNSTEVLESHLAMHPEDRDEWSRNHKLKHDPRITPIGKFLRRSSLDELPQIWNVLTGRMSLVGPRPIVAAEVEKYGEKFKYYTTVKPGITGLWQVSGRSTLSYDERVKLDRFYAEHWSLWLDLKIMVLTLKSVISSHGAF